MNIANLFGLHLGCKVRLKDGYIFTLNGVYKNNGMFKLNKRSTFNEPLKNCKLLLTPLDKITEEDKRELVEKFLRSKDYAPKNLLGGAKPRLELEHVSDKRRNYWWKLPSTAIFNLRTRGYDIPDGLVPDEYKEVK